MMALTSRHLPGSHSAVKLVALTISFDHPPRRWASCMERIAQKAGRPSSLKAVAYMRRRAQPTPVPTRTALLKTPRLIFSGMRALIWETCTSWLEGAASGEP